MGPVFWPLGAVLLDRFKQGGQGCQAVSMMLFAGRRCLLCLVHRESSRPMFLCVTDYCFPHFSPKTYQKKCSPHRNVGLQETLLVHATAREGGSGSFIRV